MILKKLLELLKSIVLLSSNVNVGIESVQHSGVSNYKDKIFIDTRTQSSGSLVCGIKQEK
jgi:hypothetical protein